MRAVRDQTESEWRRSPYRTAVLFSGAVCFASLIEPRTSSPFAAENRTQTLHVGNGGEPGEVDAHIIKAGPDDRSSQPFWRTCSAVARTQALSAFVVETRQNGGVARTERGRRTRPTSNPAAVREFDAYSLLLP